MPGEPTRRWVRCSHGGKEASSSEEEGEGEEGGEPGSAPRVVGSEAEAAVKEEEEE